MCFLSLVERAPGATKPSIVHPVIDGELQISFGVSFQKSYNLGTPSVPVYPSSGNLVAAMDALQLNATCDSNADVEIS